MSADSADGDAERKQVALEEQLEASDTIRQVVSTAGQVANTAINTAGKRVVAKIDPSQKTSVANTPKPTMSISPMTMLVVAAVVVAVVVVSRGRSSNS